MQDPRGGEGGARLGRVVHERASGKPDYEFFSRISMVMMVMKVPKADMVINVPAVMRKHGYGNDYKHARSQHGVEWNTIKHANEKAMASDFDKIFENCYASCSFGLAKDK